ncbi:Extracellular solute-binding protein family 3 [Pseudodesulfovibrio profundus]|uniref:Extracellular solute-binding protein family 3 n=1 Tax=Pseudodesulfovibrio profundus TaxID=57320 RepID=A0A2C8FBP8_9BACT|nr:Extracellular solute-binding protein family 3 [Pseudodesulfovibrio profundus]
MRFIGPLLLIATFFFLCFGAGERALAQRNALPIVFEEYPPYEFVEDGQVKGINMDIIREAFKRMGITPFFEPRPWNRAIYQLKTGEILALSSGFRTKDRQLFAYFPDTPLALETNMVITRSDRDISIKSLDDLRPLRIGVVRGYAYGTKFDTMRGLNIIEAQSAHQLLLMLLNDRMDVAICNQTVFKYIARKEEALDKIRFVFEVSREPLYLMFSRAHGQRAKQLANDFGAVVRQMVKDGSFAAIEARY